MNQLSPLIFSCFIFSLVNSSPDLLEIVIKLSQYHIVAIFHCEETIGLSNLSNLTKESNKKYGLMIETYDLGDEKAVDDFLLYLSYFRNTIIDLDCPNSGKILEKASELKVINESVHYFLLGSDFNHTVDMVKRQDVQINSKITLIMRLEDAVNVFQVHSPGIRRSKKINFITLGNCSQGVCDIAKPKLNYNMEQTYIDVAFVLPKTPPGKLTFQYAMNFVPNNYGYTFIRSVNPVVKLISEYFNFTIRWIRVNDWGYILKDNFTYNGAMGMFQRKELDMMSATLIYTMPRALYVDSGLESPQLVRQKFIFLHPHSGKGVSSNKNVFLRPLSSGVWTSIAISVSLGLLTLLISQRLEHQLINRNEIVNIIVTIIGIVAQQGFVHQIRTVYFKITVLTMLILSFFLFQFYSASIVGTLLTPFPKTIRTADDLLNSDLKVILENVPSAGPILKVYTPELYKQKIIEDKSLTPFNMTEGLKLVRKGGYAFFVYIDEARDIIKRTFTEEEINDLQEVDFVQQSFKRMTIFPVIKHAPWREVIRVANKKIIEVGISDYWNKRYIAKRPFGNSNKMVADVNLGQVSSLLYLLMYAFGISIGIFLLETVLKQTKTKFFPKKIQP